MQNNGFSTNKTWNVRGQIMDLSSPKIMGILNVTPDSFFDGSKYDDLQRALTQASRMIEEGVDIIDVGGYSSRPGADDINIAEETRRVVPVIDAIVKEFPATYISIDTFRSEVAKAALDAGAAIINDITGGDADPLLPKLAARERAPFVVMHTRGTPKTMNQLTNYDDVVGEVLSALQAKVKAYIELGMTDIAVDPGFGFAKTVGQNFEMLSKLDVFQMIGQPLLVGLSRKSMIWRTLETNPEGALNGTTSLNTIALMKGANILRVHDVKPAVECVKLVREFSIYEVRSTI
jgi:dihydropteroate synthase